MVQFLISHHWKVRWLPCTVKYWICWPLG